MVYALDAVIRRFGLSGELVSKTSINFRVDGIASLTSWGSFSVVYASSALSKEPATLRRAIDLSEHPVRPIATMTSITGTILLPLFPDWVRYSMDVLHTPAGMAALFNSEKSEVS